MATQQKPVYWCQVCGHAVMAIESICVLQDDQGDKKLACIECAICSKVTGVSGLNGRRAYPVGPGMLRSEL